MSTEAVMKGLDVLQSLGVVDLVISGGNPLLRDDIDEIIVHASKHFITTVYDNGSMALEKADALGQADFVAISIDSLDPEKNDYTRGAKGALKRAMQAVTQLHEKGISVGVAPTISQLNLYEIPDLTRYFASRNIPVWYSLYSYDSTVDNGRLFGIGTKDDEFAIADREGMGKLCDALILMKKKYGNILVTSKLLNAIKSYYVNGERTWRCRALRNFLMIDHLGRVAGCHLHEPIATISDLPQSWNAQHLKELRRQYSKCTKCTYMCYIFYSVHGGTLASLEIAQDQWRNANLLLKKLPIAQLSWKRRVTQN